MVNILGFGREKEKPEGNNLFIAKGFDAVSAEIRR